MTALRLPSLVFVVLVGALRAFAQDDLVFKEAHEAILRTLEMPLGSSGEHSMHLRLQGSEERKGERVTYELWNPKIHVRLRPGKELSVADKLNIKEQTLWEGQAMLTADAYRVLVNPESINRGELRYRRWETPPSSFDRNDLLWFSLSKNAAGWKVINTERGAVSSSEPPYDKVIALSLAPPAKPDSTCSQNELKAVFSELIHSRTAENLVLVERTVTDNFINEDRHHEFHMPVIEFDLLPLTVTQALNGDVIASVRINCDAHRIAKTVRSKTASTLKNPPEQGQSLWPEVTAGNEWKSGASSRTKDDWDYVGIRKAGKWKFTVSSFMRNPVLGTTVPLPNESIVLLPKGESPDPADELKAIDLPAKKPLSGVGVVVAPKGNVMEVRSIVAGGPAEKSGQLRVGDRIIAIADGDLSTVWAKIDLTDEKDERAVQVSDVLRMLRGKAGTTVLLKVQPAGTSDPSNSKEVRIVREELSAK